MYLKIILFQYITKMAKSNFYCFSKQHYQIFTLKYCFKTDMLNKEQLKYKITYLKLLYRHLNRHI